MARRKMSLAYLLLVRVGHIQDNPTDGELAMKGSRPLGKKSRLSALQVRAVRKLHQAKATIVYNLFSCQLRLAFPP